NASARVHSQIHSVQRAARRRCGASPPAVFCATHETNDHSRRKPAAGDRRRESVTADAAALAAPAAKAERSARFGIVAGWLWSGALLALLGFLVLYPVALGGRLEALELGTHARHEIGSDVDVVL